MTDRPHPDPDSRDLVRLAALQSYDLLDTPAEPAFDDFARVAASIAGTPIAAVSLLDRDRQWSKARIGLAAPEMPRAASFCDAAIQQRDVFVVHDALHDPRFRGTPLVQGADPVRAYAGAPLLTPDGHAIGTICVMDRVPRDFSAELCEALQTLAGHVMAQLELRRRLAEFKRSNAPRRRFIAEVHRAIETGEFVLNYLPTFDVRSGQIESLEALIRWNSPEHGRLAPSEFIPILEDCGLIVEVGSWVMHQAAADYRSWLERGLTAPRITVNVSPRQLLHPQFIEQLGHALDPDGASRVPLDLEITEAVIVENTAAVVRTLQRAQRLGVQIAIDDFGTGYSSLRYLAQLPVNTLKIDRSFVASMTGSAEDMGLVSSIISLAHGLNLTVVAEGVETAEQRKLLSLLRCDLMQGYLFSMPVSKDGMEELLRRDLAQAAARWQAVMQHPHVLEEIPA